MSPGTCSDSDEQMEGGHGDIRQEEMRGEGVGRERQGRGGSKHRESQIHHHLPHYFMELCWFPIERIG